MRERVAFLFGKDPVLSRGGDVTLLRLLREHAGEAYDTEVICLSEDPSLRDPDVVRVRKEPVSLLPLAIRALGRRRSLVHTRFDVDGLRDAVARSTADRFVAVHGYLAEAYLRSPDADSRRRLWVSTEVSEAPVWRSRGRAGRWEARRLERDERRVLGSARAVAGYDAEEMAELAAAGLAAHWLPLTLPPAERVPVGGNPPRLVFLGNRQWAPNAQAVDEIVRAWSRIRAGIPAAELWLIGARPSGAEPVTGPGVVDHGEVPDVDVLLAQCRALVAPVPVGGGVRVKVLEAAARGLPVVCSAAGLGSIERLLGLTASDGAAFVARCRELLQDPALADAEGAALHATNQQLWDDGRGRDAVLGWLGS